MNIITFDMNGGLVSKLFEVRPDVGYDVAKLAEIGEQWGLTPEEFEYIYDYVLNSDAFLLVVDGEEAVRESAEGKSQDARLVQFLQGVWRFKEQNRWSPRLRGIAVLFTKTDRIGVSTQLKRDPTPDALRDFVRTKMFQTHAQLIAISARLGVKAAYFYSWLLPEKRDAEDNILRFRVRDNMVEYPKDQFVKILTWAETL